MRYTSNSAKALAFVLSCLLAVQSWGQTQVNPKTQIRWPLLTGTVNPVAPDFPCTATQYGMSYTNLTTGIIFSCATAGWIAIGGQVPGFVFPFGSTAISLSGTEAASFVPVGVNSTSAVLRQLTLDDLAPGFSITSFTGGSVVEVGATVTNPAFAATYSATPVSAQITNTDGINSPFVMTTPFTSATITGSFVHTTITTTTFTLSAVSTSTRTATQAINWQARVFPGVGATGATSSVTASGTTAVLSNGAVLPSGGLYGTSAQLVGSLFTVSPSAQKVYLLLIGGSHTFKDATTGFTFAFNSPTAVSFVNANGSTVAMFLYESTNTLSGTFTVQVVS